MASPPPPPPHTKPPIVDIHTHIYPPSYISLLESRTSIPYIRSFPPSPQKRLVILPAEDNTPSTSRGRPIGPEYYDISEKLKFMAAHAIDISVISLANPWLDWLPPSAASDAATSINDEVNSICALHPGRLFFFGTLPLSAPAAAVLASIAHLTTLPFARGVILGTSGLGAGLDDAALLPIFAALAAARLPIFLHPHYGLPGEVFGPRHAAGDYGHVLPLALGFPLETTVAVTRMLLAGVFDAVPALRVIVAHAGGALPFLAGRIESCVVHDAHVAGEGRARRDVWEVLRSNVFLDAVVYSKVGLGAAVAASGAERVMFGTDHPFFPPLEGEVYAGEEGRWRSVGENVEAVRGVFGEGEEAEEVLGGNAVRILRLTLDG
jgi:predicted TIM-barrel fold metal-dependent hydrolase